MAAAGLGSRRGCEQLIEEGRVLVNGKTVTELPVFVEPSDQIMVDGRPVRHKPEPLVYFMLNKPRGVVCTNRDPAGRRRAIDLLEGVRERVYPVGRLDADSQGLLLLTNDGELANRLTHLRYEVPKTYEVRVDGRVTGEQVEKLLAGIRLAEGKASADRIRVVSRGDRESRLAITISEGRNFQVHQVLEGLGHKVRRLRRVSVGNLTLGGVGVGKWRPLTGNEVRYLKRLAGMGRTNNDG